MPEADDNGLDGASMAGARLEKADEQPLSVLPGATQELTVTYLDAQGKPVSGVIVDFGLWGAASGASLAPALPTGEAGTATAVLRAGSTVSSFQVRASAMGVEPVFFDVNIKDPESPTATVRVTYDGQRSIVSRSVTLVPAMSCNDVMQATQENIRAGMTQVLLKAEDPARFTLGSGMSYAVMAWGSDLDNGKLAYGCTDLAAVVPANLAEASSEVQLVLHDTDLNVEPGSFELSFSLDVSQPLLALKASAEQAVFARLPKKTQPGAGFYLDFIESTLGALDTRASLGLDQELETLLNQANGGPMVFAARMAQLVSQQGSKATLAASLSAPAQNAIGNTLAVSRIDAVAADIARALPMLGALSADSQLTAHYDEAQAAIIIDSLSLRLGLGSYTSWLLDQIGAPADLVTLLSPSHGCAQVALLVSKHPSLLITPSQAELACRQAAASLASSVRTSWQTFDSSHPYIWFQGAVPVHDRDLNRELGPLAARKVDDIGPAELSASWSQTYSAAAEDTVGATLRVPPSTALAL